MKARKKTPVLGVDLGTTNSLACIVEDEGGGSRNPNVQRAIYELTGIQPILAPRPEHQIVFGAAAYAASLTDIQQ